MIRFFFIFYFLFLFFIFIFYFYFYFYFLFLSGLQFVPESGPPRDRYTAGDFSNGYLIFTPVKPNIDTSMYGDNPIREYYSPIPVPATRISTTPNIDQVIGGEETLKIRFF